MGKPQLARNLIPPNLEKSMKIGYWTARPATLWNIVLPSMFFVTFQLLLGISQFVTARASRHQNLEFLHFAVVDSHSIEEF